MYANIYIMPKRNMEANVTGIYNLILYTITALTMKELTSRCIHRALHCDIKHVTCC